MPTKTEARAELARRARRELQRRRAQSCLADFVLYTYDGYQMGWFHREVCDVLDKFLLDVIDGMSPRLFLAAPPRSGKSEICSRRFPAYALGRYPDLELIACSYSAELTERMNRDVQRIIDDEPFHDIFPSTYLQGSAFCPKGSKVAARTSDYFEVVGHKGRYRSTGVGGSITGMGAQILIIDDPVKDREAANSKTIRDKTWDWFTSTAYTRLAPGGGVIVMATRWHPIKDDTPILTATGWKQHGDLKVGDKVFGLDGKLVNVIDIGEPVMCTVKAITSTESIVCGETHVWPVKSRAEHNHVNQTAKKLINVCTKRLLPRPPALTYPKQRKALPIDPYWFGLWLGDGDKSAPEIRCGHGYTAHCESTPYAYRRTVDREGNYVYHYRFQGLRKKLDELGVLFNKHIPRVYLKASYEERLQLLAGLIDSDGDKTAKNILRFANTNVRLLDGIEELIHSLGMFCNNRSLVNKQGTIALVTKKSTPTKGYVRNFDCYRLSFSPTVAVPCRVDYKRPTALKTRLRGISFEYARPEECGLGRCITTDAKDGIYLVGRTLMPTHNCDDLSGHLMALSERGEGEHYEVVNYPAIAEHDEPHRKAGEPLHPERFGLAALNRIRQNVGERDWAALYQQRPVPDGGGMFKEAWLRYYQPGDLPPRYDKVVISWDMTFKESDTSDYVVGQVWGRKGANFYLLDQVRGRMDFVKTLDAFVALARKHPTVIRKLVEDKANGPAIISALRNKVSGIVPVVPKESKEARASAVSTFWEAGNVYLPDPTANPWVRLEFVPELTSFPAGAHDDQVDAMSQALNDLKSGLNRIDPTNLDYFLQTGVL